MTRKCKEKHSVLIDALEAVLFPFQESEEEQEHFTDIGRQRADAWIDSLLRCPMCKQVRQCSSCIITPANENRRAPRGMLRHVKREFRAGKLGVRVSVPTVDEPLAWDGKFDVFTEADVNAALAKIKADATGSPDDTGQNPTS